ncbi:IS982 family transposase [Ktedonobacter robiniae]|uniref:Transposase n=1 Tax=Ktedonobacter robiniae TaxID=2778365 RepID=A0ABQ3UTL8_9CHLR|nr:IS982 family transposase [Ktedonobacter robiniae]GHO55995.1 transposase [Ktedonobacter robiniae]GHO56741.1 transposase [Ktedonobacter robiniae]
MSVLELFCAVDDFVMSFAPQLQASQLAASKQRARAGQLWPSEIMTILIHFHQSRYRTFKSYYTQHVQVHLTSEFPHLVSYQRFVALIPSVQVPLLAYLQRCYGACTGISFIDSTSLEVCDPKRISQHRVFAADAKRGKTSTGWFYGFKLHLAVNDRGELLACCLTPGNVDDRAPVPTLVKKLRGKLFGDRGYISAPLTLWLFEQGLQLITRLRKNMKDCLMHLSDKLLLRKRAIIESIIDQLKNISQIEHSRHRSPTNFVIHLIAGLIAYSHQEKKPGLHLDEHALLAA